MNTTTCSIRVKVPHQGFQLTLENAAERKTSQALSRTSPHILIKRSKSLNIMGFSGMTMSSLSRLGLLLCFLNVSTIPVSGHNLNLMRRLSNGNRDARRRRLPTSDKPVTFEIGDKVRIKEQASKSYYIPIGKKGKRHLIDCLTIVEVARVDEYGVKVWVEFQKPPKRSRSKARVDDNGKVWESLKPPKQAGSKPGKMKKYGVLVQPEHLNKVCSKAPACYPGRRAMVPQQDDVVKIISTGDKGIVYQCLGDKCELIPMRSKGDYVTNFDDLFPTEDLELLKRPGKRLKPPKGKMTVFTPAMESLEEIGPEGSSR